MIRTIPQPGQKSFELTRASALYQGASRVLLRHLPFLPSDQRYNITICHERQFIWFRVSKVASRTIFDLFQQAEVKLDAEHPMFCHYPVRLYRHYFKFAFVRNPWDRLVSCWNDKVIRTGYFGRTKEANLKLHDFSRFIDRVSKSDVTRCDQHFRLQSKLIDLNHVDFIGRFETFEQDISHVIRKLDLGDVELKRKNASPKRGNYRDYYNEEQRELVGKIYQRDLNLFSYDF